MSDDNQVTELTELTDLITSSNGARILKRDNVLIKAVYNATALETKIFLRALYDAQQTSRFEFNYSTKEIAEIIGNSVDEHIYAALHKATNNMVSNTIYIWDGRKKSSEAFAIVPYCSYDGGVFSIQLNQKLTPYLIDIDPPYTAVDINKLKKLSRKYLTDKNFSMRLYDILNTKIYLFEKDESLMSIEEYFSLEELKLRTGLVVAVNEDLGKVIDKYGFTAPALAAAGDPYPVWYDFKRRILEPAIKEINQNMDMRLRYIPKRVGSSGRTVGITFIIDRPERTDRGVADEAAPKDEGVQALKEIIHEEISDEAAESILKAAGGDIEKVRAAYGLKEEREQAGLVTKDPVAWMISAIRGNYPASGMPVRKEMKPAGKGPGTKKGHEDRFGFPQNEYDFDQLEAEILSPLDEAPE